VVKISIINGSLGGRSGNTGHLINKIRKILQKIDPSIKVCVLNLSPSFDWLRIRKGIRSSDGLLFCSGTYWDSWGSPMQQLFEKMTQIEGKKHLVGKPVSVIVTMHSVGGKEIVSRMQGVLCSMGCMIPPFTGFAYSYSDHIAHKSRVTGKKLLDDVWHINDLNALLGNLVEAVKKTNNWKVWDYLDTNALDPAYIWLK
jgi:multimeric flavodoxin WrbA